MSKRTIAVLLVLAVAGLALVLVPIVLHAGFGIETWPLPRVRPWSTAVPGGLTLD